MLPVTDGTVRDRVCRLERQTNDPKTHHPNKHLGDPVVFVPYVKIGISSDVAYFVNLKNPIYIIFVRR